MTNPLAWIAAIGGVLATIGTWLGPARTRWELRAEAIRGGQDRRENDLHRQRFTEAWHLWHDQPDGEERVRLARWYTEWTGTAAPGRAGIDATAQAPGFGCASAEEAYDRYIGTLDARYNPGRLGRPRRSFGVARAIIRRRPGQAGETTGGHSPA
jgi:hypothetical protein